MLVYLITDGDYFKIGLTKKNAEKRLKELQTGSARELTLVETYSSKNYRKIESWFHRKYKWKRLEGEWFALEPEDVDNFLTEAKKIDKNIDTLRDNPFF
jgi:hypothetical protein